VELNGDEQTPHGRIVLNCLASTCFAGLKQAGSSLTYSGQDYKRNEMIGAFKISATWVPICPNLFSSSFYPAVLWP